MQKYGVDNYSKTAECTRKKKSTKLERHGDENYVNPEKAKFTKKLRYGDCTGPAQKAAATCLEKYGVRNYAETEQFKQRIRRSRSDAVLEKLGKSDVELLDRVEEFVVRDKAAHRWRCRKCGLEFVARYDSNFETRFGIPVRCPACHPVSPGYSNEEKDFVSFVKSVYRGMAVENTKSVIRPYELDLYLPGERIAFEFDGLYWHSEQAGKARSYHLKKTEACEAAGIRLVHVFESEWTSRKGAVKSRVKRMLGRCGRTICAAECDAREIASCESDAFLDENDVVRHAVTTAGIGLHFKNELVSAGAFRKVLPGEWELEGFCDKLDCHVAGSFETLLERFEDMFRPKLLTCRVDRRWSDGKSCTGAGFRLARTLGPACWRFDRSRQLQPASEQDAESPEPDGFMRIFDCGSYVFEKRYPSGV